MHSLPSYRLQGVGLWCSGSSPRSLLRHIRPLFCSSLLLTPVLFQTNCLHAPPAPLDRVPSSRQPPPSLGPTPLSPFHQQMKAYGASSIRPPVPCWGQALPSTFVTTTAPTPQSSPQVSGAAGGTLEPSPGKVLPAGDYSPFLHLSESGSSSIKWE